MGKNCVKKTGFSVESLMLQGWLDEEAKNVIPKLPNPFESFEKAKYVLLSPCVHERSSYKFITTCRNTEDAIEIMKDMFERNYYSTRCKYFRVLKEVNGERKIVYESERNGRP